MYIKLETAREAKEKGFEWEEGMCLYVNGEFVENSKPDWHHANEELLPASNQSQLQEWIRNNHKLHPVVMPTITSYWTFKILDVQCDPENQIERPPYINVDAYDYQTYEEALEVGLIKMIEMI